MEKKIKFFVISLVIIVAVSYFISYIIESTKISVFSVPKKIDDNQNMNQDLIYDETDYEVVRVVDGDTIVVKIGEKEENIRLIGMDAPEVANGGKKAECFGEESTAEARAILEGDTVRLETDPTQEERDIYGRLLAYVWTDSNILFEEYMIENGFAREYTYMGIPYKYQEILKEKQDMAQSAGAGLWSLDACQN